MAQLQHSQLLQPVQMQHRGVIAPLQEDTVLPSVAVALGQVVLNHHIAAGPRAFPRWRNVVLATHFAGLVLQYFLFSGRVRDAVTSAQLTEYFKKVDLHFEERLLRQKHQALRQVKFLVLSAWPSRFLAQPQAALDPRPLLCQTTAT